MNNIFQSMKKPLLAIEIDDYAFKLMQAKVTAKGWDINKFFIENIEGKSQDDIASQIKEILKKNNFKKGPVTLIIPRSLVTVRYIQLPTTNPVELKSMVDIQVVRQIPYTKEEMIYDYEPISLTEEGFTKVMIAIAHKDIISKYLQILKKANIIPDSIQLDSMAVAGLCRFLNTGESKFMNEKPVAILDIDYITTNIIILQSGAPMFMRAVSIGSNQVTGKTSQVSGKDWMGEWIGEINRSLTVFQKEAAEPIEKIVILGDYTNRFAPLLADKISIPAIGYDFRKNLIGVDTLTEKQTNTRLDDSTGFSLAGLLGAIKEGTDTAINLMPPEVLLSVHNAGKRRSLILTMLLIAGILGSCGLTLDKKIKDKKSYLASLEKKLKETNPLAKELSVKKDRLELIKKQISITGSSLDIIKELYTVIPQKTALNVLIYDDAQGVTIKGASPAMSDVFDLIPKLENSPYFENVTSRYATQRKIKGQELTEFQIDCSISTAKEAG